MNIHCWKRSNGLFSKIKSRDGACIQVRFLGRDIPPMEWGKICKRKECYPDIPKNLAEKFLEIAKEDAKKMKEILSEEEILFLMSK